MKAQEILPNLFRKEYQKMVSVLSHQFGFQNIDIAEDIISDTFLAATESWSINGIPKYPEAWLYKTAKNKARNYLKHLQIFNSKVAPELARSFSEVKQDIKIDLSDKNIEDSQLAMIFSLCNFKINEETKISLALHILCGFGVSEIAEAYLTNHEIIYKRIQRGKKRLKDLNISIEYPSLTQIEESLDAVLKVIYLVFSEGYYSVSKNTILRKDFCYEAMRMTTLLLTNSHCNLPQVNALMALMCFHASRFEARLNKSGEIILYDDQDVSLWNNELIKEGGYFLSESSKGRILSKYHLEAAIAYWHTHKDDTIQKWNHILELYDELVKIEISPVILLNRAYVISKVKGTFAALKEIEGIKEMKEDHLFHTLLGTLYKEIDLTKALSEFQCALTLAKTTADKVIIRKKIKEITALLADIN